MQCTGGGSSGTSVMTEFRGIGGCYVQILTVGLEVVVLVAAVVVIAVTTTKRFSYQFST
jgi:hypothetical protein